MGFGERNITCFSNGYSIAQNKEEQQKKEEIEKRRRSDIEEAFYRFGAESGPESYSNVHRVLKSAGAVRFLFHGLLVCTVLRFRRSGGV